MSRRYAVAGVSILNPTVSPRLTLMSVAKPWIELLPAPVMPHSLSGLPGFVFSQATGLTTGASHGAAFAGAAGTTAVRTAAISTAARRPPSARDRRPPWARARPPFMTHPPF